MSDSREADVIIGSQIEGALEGFKQVIEGFTGVVDAIKAPLENIQEFGEALLAVFAVERIDAWLERVTQVSENLERMSKMTGASIETLSTFNTALQLSGAGSEGAGRAMLRLDQNIQQAQQGVGRAGAAFRQLGISVTDSQGNLKSVDEILNEMADSYSHFEDGATKSANAMELLSRYGISLLPVLDKGREGLDQMRAKAEELGVSTNEALNAKFVETGEKLHEFSLALTGLGSSIFIMVKPGIDKLLDWLTTIVVNLKDIVKYINTIRDAGDKAEKQKLTTEDWRQSVLQTDGVWYTAAGAVDYYNKKIIETNDRLTELKAKQVDAAAAARAGAAADPSQRISPLTGEPIIATSVKPLVDTGPTVKQLTADLKYYGDELLKIQQRYPETIASTRQMNALIDQSGQPTDKKKMAPPPDAGAAVAAIQGQLAQVDALYQQEIQKEEDLRKQGVITTKEATDAEMAALYTKHTLTMELLAQEASIGDQTGAKKIALNEKMKTEDTKYQTESAALVQKYWEETTKLTQKGYDDQISIVNRLYDDTKKRVDDALHEHQITQAQATAILISNEDKRHDYVVKDIQAIEALYGQNAAEYENAQKQMELETEKHTTAIEAINKQASDAFQKQWTTVIGEVTSSMRAFFQDWISGNETAAVAAQKAMQQLVTKWIEDVVTMLAELAVWKAAAAANFTTVATAMQGAVGGTSGFGAIIAQLIGPMLGLTTATATDQLSLDLNTTQLVANNTALAANTLALVNSMGSGWLSTAFSSAGLGIGIIGLQQGAWNIPSNQIALLHAGEMVLPPAVAAQARANPGATYAAGAPKAAAGGGTNVTQGDTNITLNLSAMDGVSAGQFLRNQAPALISTIALAARNNNMALKQAIATASPV